MSTDNFTTGKSITQSAAIMDFVQESHADNDLTGLQFNGNTPEYYTWLESYASQFVKPNILDIFSSSDPGTSSYLRHLGYFVQVTDADRDNLDFLNNLPDSDIESPAKFFDILTESISKEYQLVIWHKSQIKHNIEELTICFKKISDCLPKGGFLISDIQYPQILINQFDKELLLQTNQFFKKSEKDPIFQVFKKL